MKYPEGKNFGNIFLKNVHIHKIVKTQYDETYNIRNNAN